LDDPPIHIRPVVRASVGADGKNPRIQAITAYLAQHRELAIAKDFFAESVNSQAIKVECF
jgi:hypothetical protein